MWDIYNKSVKIKHIREKDYYSSHPLYDLMGSICNPEGENSGHTVEYKGRTFRLSSCRDIYFDEHGVPLREVDVINLDQQESQWTVFRKDAGELEKETKENDNREFTSNTVDYSYDEGHLSWVTHRDFNDRGELIHMEESFYGSSFDGFSDSPRYTLISDLTYEYDQYDNWILCYLCCVDGLQPDELTIREFEYWP